MRNGNGATPSAAMTVGPNVQVSQAFPRRAHYESLAAADPDHPGRMIACIEVEHMEHAARSQHCYASFDNGKTWSVALDLDQSRSLQREHRGKPKNLHRGGRR
jgi:hypothetical protein